MVTSLPLLDCQRCGSRIPDSSEKCLTCGHYAGPPNVRAARRVEETSALNRRYVEAVARAKTNGTDRQLLKLEEAAKASFAVINVGLDFLFHFVTNDKLLYSTYSLATKGKIRKPALRSDEEDRLAVEAKLFGGYGDEMRYAALSADGSGVRSYGAFTLRLRDVTITDRATLLEENSFAFVEKHGVRLRQRPPVGYRATWEDRHKLVVAKLADRISPSTSEAELPKMMLRSEGDRATDDFVEVHIFGAFDINAVESVRGNSSPLSKDERALISIVKAHLQKLGKDWIEE
jgi:hypothetical protein